MSRRRYYEPMIINTEYYHIEELIDQIKNKNKIYYRKEDAINYLFEKYQYLADEFGLDINKEDFLKDLDKNFAVVGDYVFFIKIVSF